MKAKPLLSKACPLAPLLLLTLATLGCRAEATRAEPVQPAHHWSYSGAEGPSAWGQLESDFALCKTGHSQSPVDVLGFDHEESAVSFDYTPGSGEVENNGHTVQVDVGKGEVTSDGVVYSLQQLHFHAPSEHALRGKHFAMECHLVHLSKQGHVAVVGLLFDVGAQNPALNDLVGALPLAPGERKTLPSPFDPGSLLPEDRTYHRYWGSLTTPPCSEGVKWILLTEPQQVSTAQLDRIIASLGESNARPIQRISQD